MIRLAAPIMGAEELRAVQKVLESGNLVQGGEVAAFESSVADYLGLPHAVAVSSCTAALHLTLLGLGVGPGDEVVVPDFTFPATVNAVEMTGANAVFCDIRKESFCIDHALLERLLTPRTKVIMVVHEFGLACEMDPIRELAARRGVHLVEDAACALGSAYRGVKAGNFGIAGCFSFHPRKAVTTGEGGIIATRDAALAKRLRCLRNHGMQSVDGRIDFVEAGLNYRMTDFQGALGVVQMAKLSGIIEKRRELAASYHEQLKGNVRLLLPEAPPHARHVYQTYHLLLDGTCDRDAVVATLREQGIESNYGAYAVHAQSYYRRKYGLDDHRFPESMRAYRQGLALPLHTGLTQAELEFVCRKVNEIVS
jgi:perosamine synthetase